MIQIQARGRPVTLGIFSFIAFSFCSSWLVAALLRTLDLNQLSNSTGTRLFATSILYTLTMGWQPILATWIVQKWVDSNNNQPLGLTHAKPIFSIIGVLGAIFLAVGAMGIGWLAVRAGVISAISLNGDAEAGITQHTPSLASIMILVMACVGALILIWLQSVTEEIGWRGYFLPRAMQRWGHWPGLFIHGAVWGIWYAPVLFLSTYGQLSPLTAIQKSLGFVITCILIGTLLGWLRLASKSLLPTIAANTTLTLVAGLPYMLHGIDAGLRATIYGPVGWLVLIFGIALLVLSKWRFIIQSPL